MLRPLFYPSNTLAPSSNLRAFGTLLNARAYADACQMWAASNLLTGALWSVYHEMSDADTRIARVMLGIGWFDGMVA